MYKKPLLELGQWLQINGEAIYGTSPWVYQRDSRSSYVWYTCLKTETLANRDPERYKITAIYVLFLEWPKNSLLLIRNLFIHMIGGDFQIDLLISNGSTPVKVRYAVRHGK